LKLLTHAGVGRDFENYVAIPFNISITDMQTDLMLLCRKSRDTNFFGNSNTGKNTANSLIVRIPRQDGFRTSGTSEQIVGNLASGDYTIVSFNVVPTAARNVTRSMDIVAVTLIRKHKCSRFSWIILMDSKKKECDKRNPGREFVTRQFYIRGMAFGNRRAVILVRARNCLELCGGGM